MSSTISPLVNVRRNTGGQKNHTRNHAIDNIKGFLIILVVLGHAIHHLESGVWQHIYSGIYTFHMPAFIFISGLVTNPKKWKIDSVSLLGLYCILLVLWFAFAAALKIAGISSAAPPYSILIFVSSTAGLWYLISLAGWRLVSPLLFDVRHPVLFLLGSAIYCSGVGVSEQINGAFSIDALVLYFPFFAGGIFAQRFVFRGKDVQLQKYQGILAGSVFLVGATWLVIVSSSYHGLLTPPLGSFSSMGISPISGVLCRMSYYLIATFAIIALLVFSPNSESVLCRFGRNSLSIYIGHFYILSLAIKYINASNAVFFVPLAVLFCIVILSVFPFARPAERLRDWVISRIFNFTT